MMSTHSPRSTTPQRMPLLLTVVLTIVIATGSLTASNANAQYFQTKAQSSVSVLKAKGLDSILFTQMTPFGVPRIPDTVGFTYHEPLPDSVMPRSAMVIGSVTIQSTYPDKVVEYLETVARERGADWIVSFAEPRLRLTKSGERYYRSSATLLRVLDPSLIPQRELAVKEY